MLYVWTKAVRLQILCMWWYLNTEALSVLRRVSGLGPQGKKSSKGEQNDLHAQVLPLLSRNIIKTFTFGLSSELKLSVTKTIFTSCRSNAHPNIQQEFSKPGSATKVVKFYIWNILSECSQQYQQLSDRCTHVIINQLIIYLFIISHISYSLPSQKAHKETLMFGSLLSIEFQRWCRG